MKNLIQTKIPNVYAVKVPIDANDFRLYFEIGHTRLLYNKLSEDKFPITDYSFQNLVMKELGITYQKSTPQSICDQWWFWNCENVPEKLPSYLEELRLDPMDCVGNGLSKEDAESIRDYKL